MMRIFFCVNTFLNILTAREKPQVFTSYRLSELSFLIKESFRLTNNIKKNNGTKQFLSVLNDKQEVKYLCFPFNHRIEKLTFSSYYVIR